MQLNGNYGFIILFGTIYIERGQDFMPVAVANV